MEKIYEKDGYTVSANITNGKAVISFNGKSQELRLERLNNTMPRFLSSALKKAGKNPADYRHVVGSNAVIKADAIQSWSSAVESRDAYLVAKIKADKKALSDNVTGLRELKSMRQEWTQYYRMFNRMMADGNNDGVNPPVKPNVSVEELAEKYPRASLYLKADSQVRCATNISKGDAGKKCMEMIINGADLDAAKKALDNWEIGYVD